MSNSDSDSYSSESTDSDSDCYIDYPVYSTNNASLNTTTSTNTILPNMTMENTELTKKLSTVVKTHSKKISPKNNNQNINITTEGLDESYLKNMDLKYVQDIVQCHCCSKYYNKSLIINDFEGIGEQICKHCICWLNYTPETRLEFDSKCVIYGFCIAEYILSCNESHDTTTCTRMTDQGGCLLCDYKLDLNIPNILNRELLPKFNPSLTNNSTNNSTKKNTKKIMIVDNDIALHGSEEYFKNTKIII